LLATILALCAAPAAYLPDSVKSCLAFSLPVALFALINVLAEPVVAASTVDEPKAAAVITEGRKPSSSQAAFAVQLRQNQALIKLMASPSSAVDLRSVGDLIILCRRKVTDNPYDSNLRLKLGGYLYLVGDLEGAAGEMKRAVAIKPDDYLAHTLLARVLDQALDESTADIEFKRAIQLRPTESYAHEYFADSLFRRGEVSEAINQYRQATQLRATASAFSGLADALLSSRDVTGAVKAARQAVSAEPSSARAHCSLTRALYASKNIAGACDEFRQAVKIDPLNAQARNDLGYALYGSGDVASAVSELRLALRLNPHLSEARNNLEIAIYGLTGQKHP
jgi:Flp pilus assembly protein TadD